MERPLARFADPIYALFRIVVGGLLLQHGAQKLFGVLGGDTAKMGSQMWIGGLIELVCGLAVMVGYKVGWTALLASGTMAVAYFQFHQPKGSLPIQNGGELAAVYSFCFLLIAAKGPGIWSMSGRRGAS